MARALTCYGNEVPPYPYNVTFISKGGVFLIRSFDSPYMARAFMNKLRRSKQCRIVSHSKI